MVDNHFIIDFNNIQSDIIKSYYKINYPPIIIKVFSGDLIFSLYNKIIFIYIIKFKNSNGDMKEIKL
jgi:hypothetical protein